MLVLTRKVGRSVVITVPPSNAKQLVKVTLCEIGSDQVRIGFDAAKPVEILRDELIAHSPEDIDGI